MGLWDTQQKETIINNNSGSNVNKTVNNEDLWQTIIIILILAVILKAIYLIFTKKVNSMINTRLAIQNV